MLNAVNKIQNVANDILTLHADCGSVTRMIDYAAIIRREIKALQAAEKALTLALTRDATLDIETDQGARADLVGIDWKATITETVIWSLDTKALKEEFGQPWYDERCRQSVRRAVTYREI